MCRNRNVCPALTDGCRAVFLNYGTICSAWHGLETSIRWATGMSSACLRKMLKTADGQYLEVTMNHFKGEKEGRGEHESWFNNFWRETNGWEGWQKFGKLEGSKKCCWMVFFLFTKILVARGLNMWHLFLLSWLNDVAPSHAFRRTANLCNCMTVSVWKGLWNWVLLPHVTWELCH